VPRARDETRVRSGAPALPSSVVDDVGVFDRFAGWAAEIVSRAPFFVLCVALVVAWILQGAVTLALTHDWERLTSSTYQLEINTTTTIVTFLLVALLQNTQTRSDRAVQHKLNAIADALADLMSQLPTEERGVLDDDVRELELAVGLEDREGTNGTQHRSAP